uniref:Integrase, catalytic region, zinc finger, CCHC-type, peptidase aspartic, catalytic n=1 Tax=Tanacetum cinerariifolium TaxID=118510 RepID=A0A6L2JPZ3_TANCI|nr:hypothetical protein [Tanacetum cinerariifolium]
MRNIKMTMYRMQLNSKFVNNMFPEWGRFITVVKLNRGLRDSNYDQLYAYLKQHEAHANKNKMMLDQFAQHTVDLLTLMSNDSHQQYYSKSSTTPSSTYVQPHFADNTKLDSRLSSTKNLIENLTNTLALPTQSYKIYLPQTNNQLKTSSNTRNQVTVPDGKADDCNAFDSDVDEAHTIQTMFLANLLSADLVYDEASLSYDSDILSEQVQPALYNCYEIIKTNHVSAIVHNSKDILEIAKITRKKINDKMKDPECVKNKVTIAPNDYSKENYLATFTPQKHLTPEQIFWSKNLLKMKADALKGQSIDSRPIKVLTVYPPNTPATLVLRVLPTKSQVKINIFALIQLFLDFEKTCKKRITPTGLIEWERGFEQTKECYLTEVIPFFSTLKNHFEGIQKALTKEIKEMKEFFEELEAEVDQNFVNRKHDEIERKNLLIANDNLIADCLSKDVFYTATDYVLTVF